MIDSTFEFLSRFSVQAATIFIAMLPVSELRGAIPYALTLGGLPWQEAYVLSVIGNFIPVVPILYLIGPASDLLRRIALMDRFFTWLFARTRRRGKLVERFEAAGLVLFVAIPLPVTGAWTGALAAFLFGVRRTLAIPAILAGICIAGVIVTMAALGVISFWGIAARN